MRFAFQKQNIIDTGMALLASGNLKGAVVRFRKVLAQMPNQHDAIYGMACVARAEGRPDRAIALIGQVLKNDLTDDMRALYHITLGHALHEAGHLEPARAAFTVATLLTPQDFRAHAGLGGALIQQCRFEEGVESWKRAADLAAEPIPVWQAYAECLMSLRQFAAAVAPFRLIAETLAENGFAWANLGAALFEAGDTEAARAALDKAVAKGGDSAYTRVNRALTALALGYFKRAEADMARAQSLAPDDRRIRNNAATLMQQMGQTREASVIYAALMQGNDPEAPRAAYNLATLRLAEGKMRDGWRLFEARHAVLGRSSSLPPWDGRGASGSVLIEAEQGAGDFIQFMRFLPAALARVPVVLQADAALHPLIHLHPSLDAHLKSGRLRWAGEAIASCGMMSLPHLLQIAEPDDTPYLFADAITAGRSFRVGLCWRGSSQYRFDARRSIDPTLLAPVFNIPDIDFVSLQKEHDDGVEGCHITQGQLQDWRATASEIQGCDLIISVDTAIAHLAGALGKNVWLLNRFGGDWRWLGPRWYRNVTIFNAARAEPPGAAWQPVIDAVCHRLRQRADQHR